MNNIPVSYQFDTRSVDWPELETLFALADLGGRKGDKLRRAFERSQIVCFATEGDRLIGAARALSDGEYHAIIYDVVVHPERQRHGIGTSLMRQVLERLPVWRVMLVADQDVAPFYGRLGFQRFSDVLALFNPNRLYDEPVT